MHLVIPMSGQGVRFKEAGYPMPKPLVPVNGQPMIAKLLASFPISWETTFILAENQRLSELPRILKECRPRASIFFIPEHKKGPGHALNEAIGSLPQDQPIFVSYCDYGMLFDGVDFEKYVERTQCDACVISYKGFHPHYLSPTMYAYSRMNGENVVEIKEKGCFTDTRENEYASSGGYYFRTAKILADSLSYQIAENLNFNGEYYISLTMEALLRHRRTADVRVYEIPKFFQWGTPADLEAYQYWEKTFENIKKNSGRKLASVSQVLIPMAGAGSRFQDTHQVPKPFINLKTEPMFVRARNSLPESKRTVFVIKKEHEVYFLQSGYKAQHVRTVVLDHTPQGQALSVEAAKSTLEENKDIIISACDHAVVVNPVSWESFINQPNCDAAIFCIRHFPGAQRKPHAYSYVRTSEIDDAFPLIESVSVKKPIVSAKTDPLLVGTFWFKDKQVLLSGIQALKESHTLVNNEFYLDSVFNHLIDQGLKVRMIPLDGYVCWGDPDALREAIYWEEVFLAGA